MTKPLSTKNRSTPRAPAVISGPNASPAMSTPSSPGKWKWNSTTQTAATMRSPVSVRNSAGRGATPSLGRVARGEGGIVNVTIGVTREPCYARRVTVTYHPDAGNAHAASISSWACRVMSLAVRRPNHAARLPAVEVQHPVDGLAGSRPEGLTGVVGRGQQHALTH